MIITMSVYIIVNSKKKKEEEERKRKEKERKRKRRKKEYIRRVVNFKDLVTVDSGVHERGSDVNKDAESGKARATLYMVVAARC